MTRLTEAQFEALLPQLETALPLITEGRQYGLQVSIKRKLAHQLQQSDHPIAQQVLAHVTVLSS